MTPRFMWTIEAGKLVCITNISGKRFEYGKGFGAEAGGPLEVGADHVERFLYILAAEMDAKAGVW